jgi:hypothetical protein
MGFGPPKKKSTKQSRDDERAKAKRAALRALRRARAAAARSGAKLSAWEGEFLGSVEGRLETYGRAFADPEKGSPSASLSVLQSVKVREIAAKAKRGDKPKFGQNRPFSGSFRK